MCTVSFLTRADGFALAMNRDERRSRPRGRPPAAHRSGSRTVLMPSEPAGGTWIAVNDAGAAFALINWYRIDRAVTGPVASRGLVVPALAGTHGPVAAGKALARLPLDKMRPFRLVAVFPRGRRLVEWRWNGRRLIRRRWRWADRVWVSSGFDEPAAQRIRGAVFGHARRQPGAGTLTWLRQLHRSHRPEPGPFSFCMHRAEAVTVSYTDVVVTDRRVRMHHRLGSPCTDAATSSRSTLSRPRSP